jgi:RNA polymerase sigma-70 factor (ECF subfamily)
LAAAEDVEAWREFAAVYAPAVFELARRRGLQPADAEDFLQELLLAVARAAGRWQPDSSRARFRTWLQRVARNLLADHFARRARLTTSQEGCQDSPAQRAEPHATDESLAEEFELEYRRAVFHRAAQLVRQRVSATTWEAFAQTAIDAVPVAAFSLRLGVAPGSIYVARSRVMKLLRQEVERLRLEMAATDEVAATDFAGPASLAARRGP